MNHFQNITSHQFNIHGMIGLFRKITQRKSREDRHLIFLTKSEGLSMDYKFVSLTIFGNNV